MEELEDTENIQADVETLVACKFTETCTRDSKLLPLSDHYSHPGYFGKTGIRIFHKQNNRYFEPCVNLDKIWGLVSEQTRANAIKNKDKVPVIDVTKSVSTHL